MYPKIISSSAGGSSTDELAKVSANDTTAGYLNGKLVAGSLIILTENNNGGNETLTIASTLGSNTFNTDATPDSGTYGTLGGTVNGSNTVFTTLTGYISGSLQVYLNGVLQNQGAGNDYVETTPASGTFTFNTAPLTNDTVIATYKSTVSATGNADTLDGLEGAAFSQLSANNTYSGTATFSNTVTHEILTFLNRTLSVTTTIPSGYGSIIPSDYELASGVILELASDAVLEIV